MDTTKEEVSGREPSSPPAPEAVPSPRQELVQAVLSLPLSGGAGQRTEGLIPACATPLGVLTKTNLVMTTGLITPFISP